MMIFTKLNAAFAAGIMGVGGLIAAPAPQAFAAPTAAVAVAQPAGKAVSADRRIETVQNRGRRVVRVRRGNNAAIGAAVGLGILGIAAAAAAASQPAYGYYEPAYPAYRPYPSYRSQVYYDEPYYGRPVYSRPVAPVQFRDERYENWQGSRRDRLNWQRQREAQLIRQQQRAEQRAVRRQYERDRAVQWQRPGRSGYGQQNPPPYAHRANDGFFEK